MIMRIKETIYENQQVHDCTINTKERRKQVITQAFILGIYSTAHGLQPAKVLQPRKHKNVFCKKPYIFKTQMKDFKGCLLGFVL